MRVDYLIIKSNQSEATCAGRLGIVVQITASQLLRKGRMLGTELRDLLTQ